MIKPFILAAALLTASAGSLNAQEKVNIGKSNITLKSDLMTPEALWAMGRISAYAPSKGGQKIAYQVGYYSVKDNKSHHVLYMMNADGTGQQLLTTDAENETDPSWLGDRLAYLRGGEIWTMNADGTDRRQLSHTDGSVEGYKFSPDGSQVILLKSLPFHEVIKENPADLPKATGRLVTDLMYRHWDHYVESIQHPFVAQVTASGIGAGKDLLEGEPYECPMEPFGGIEQLDWSPDSKCIAYTCRKKTGVLYSISTDSDIYLYEVATGKTRNLCKPEGYLAPKVDVTKTLRNQAVNAADNLQNNPGYDQNPQFSPDGKCIAWQSMARDGYEADRNRLCVYELATGKKQYLTEKFDSDVDAFCWSDTKDAMIYFTGVWHGTFNLYSISKKGELKQLTDLVADFGSLQMLGDGKRIVAERHDYTAPADLYMVTPNSKNPQKTTVQQLTYENKHLLDQLAKPTVERRWVKTTDGNDMLSWVILPPHFDPNKKYPTLLFCEGGPQSPVSQFWSYRWNFMIMAAHGYVIVAPNRHGLPGFGSEWCEEISGDWTGQCMDDYLVAIDDAAKNLPYVDKDRLGAVGASFGVYTETEENWFSNWEYDDAFWNKDQTANARKTYANSPHRFVDKWDTPILCIHGEKDYRINATQGMSAFNAARMRGIEAELLIFPDENHWVLKPQNGILWQRTYFDWLARWLK